MSSRRQRELRRIQSELERFYGLERAPNVTRFVRDGDQGSREVVLLRESADELEIALFLPPESKQIPTGGALSDVWLQVAEGVSHFLYLVERARVSLPVTKLELELQAEVDKFVLSLGFTGISADRFDGVVNRSHDGNRFTVQGQLAAAQTRELQQIANQVRLDHRVPAQRFAQTQKVR